jgi:outer membrane immunogenic protein
MRIGVLAVPGMERDGLRQELDQTAVGDRGNIGMQKHFVGLGVLALAGALAIAAPAKAADLLNDHPDYGGYKDAPAYVAPTSWGGLYVGGHLGAAWTTGSASLDSTRCYYNEGTATNELATLDNATYSVKSPVYKKCVDSGNHVGLDDTSVIGGVHLGYNIQRGALVYGVEGDVSFADNIDYLASVRGRLGFAANNWLFYGTGGVAFLGGGYSGVISDGNIGNVTYDVSDDQVGFVVGGGVEVKVTPNWSVGVEGLYYGFDGKTYHAAGTVGDEWDYVNYNVKADGISDVGVVRARLSYHVGRGDGPLK